MIITIIIINSIINLIMNSIIILMICQIVNCVAPFEIKTKSI